MKRRTREVNPIDVVEAAYDLEPTDRAWLHKLATILRPFLDGDRGMFAYYYDSSRPMAEFRRHAIMFDLDPEEQRCAQNVVASLPDVANALHFNNQGLLAMLDTARRAGLGDLRERPLIAEHFRRFQVADIVALQTVEPSGRGVVFEASQAKPRVFAAGTRRLWARVNTHIGTARRLREAVHAHGAAEEAVLSPSGKVEHAEGEGKTKSAREALRGAVLRSEKSRGKQRKADPEGAIEAWTALVSGRWSLVDRFERDGRRYVVARRNEHTLMDPRALSPRERAIACLAALGKPNKLIGYELGLADSTIGSHLSTVMRKLGAKSRVDLIQLITHLRAPK